MKITSMLQATGSDFEQRKRLLARKEMDQAYKKNAKFVEASKNPILAALENLLSGKAEKELNNQDLEAKKQLITNPLAKSEDRSIVYDQSSNVIGADVTSSEESNQKATNSANETIELFGKVRNAALAPISPSPQDVRIAETASAQIQAINGGLLEDTEVEVEQPYTEESFDAEIPERFTNIVNRDVETPTVFGRELEKELFTRTFSKAKSTYSAHIAMVKNSYRSYNEPQFSMAV